MQIGKCIVCLSDKPLTVEHVFPFAVGGRFEIARLCADCNSDFGRRVDPILTNDFFVIFRRTTLMLAGQSGYFPKLYEPLLGKATLAETGQPVIVTYSPDCSKLNVRLIPQKTERVGEDGKTVVEYMLDSNDIGELPKIIARHRRKLGLSPLSETELQEEARRSIVRISEHSPPRVKYELKYNYVNIRQPVVKIAYELAHLWLGDEWLDDEVAAELRTYLAGDPSFECDHVSVLFMGGSLKCPMFKFWEDNVNEHLAIMAPTVDGLHIAIRVFDVHGFVVRVSRSTVPFLHKIAAAEGGRFMGIDAETGRVRNYTLREELIRLASPEHRQ